MEEERRHIELYKNYFLDFYSELSFDVREKIQYVFRIIKTAPVIPKKFLDKITGTDGLFEIRVGFESFNFMIFTLY